jgi:FimV-like protein
MKWTSKHTHLSSLMVCIGFAQTALAIGLGNITVKTKLNEPFRGTIELIDTNAIPLADLKVTHANQSAYERAGLVYSNNLGFLKYKVKGDISKPYIHITSKENVTEPFINILLRLQWPKGEVYRAYSILLDPPDYTLERFTSSVQTKVRSPVMRQRVKSHKPLRKHHIAKTIVTDSDDTLWHIARKVQKNHDASVYQIMVSIFHANPESFINHDINLLKRDQHLVIPKTHVMKRISKERAFSIFNDHAQGIEPKVSSHQHQALTHNQSHSDIQPRVSKRDQAPKDIQKRVSTVEAQTQSVAQQVEIPVESANKTQPSSDIVEPSSRNIKSNAAESKPDKSKETEITNTAVEPSNISVETASKPKVKTHVVKTPQLQMQESQTEDESNFWFLDTFDMNSPAPSNKKPKNEATQQSKEALINQQAEVKQANTKNLTADTINESAKKKSIEKQTKLIALIQAQNTKLDQHVNQLNQLSARMDQLTAAQTALSQAYAKPDQEDNFWEIVWFMTTLIGLSGTTFFAYRFYLLAKMDKALKTHSQTHAYTNEQDSIALSKRKISSDTEVDDNEGDILQPDATVASEEIEIAEIKKTESNTETINVEIDKNTTDSTEYTVEEIILDEPSMVSNTDMSEQDTPEYTLPDSIEEDLTIHETEENDITEENNITEDHVMKFDSSFSGQYHIGRKGERQEGVSHIDLPSDAKKSEDNTSDKIDSASSSSQQSIASKIDLATAYITMNDKVNARQVLQEILDAGNEHEIEIAKKLLGEMD